MWFIIYDKAGYQLKHELTRTLGIGKETPEKVYNVLRKLRPEQKAYLLRRVLLDQYGGNYPKSNYGFIIYKIAKAYGDIDVVGFEKEQSEIRANRETRAKQRVADLRTKTKRND